HNRGSARVGAFHPDPLPRLEVAQECWGPGLGPSILSPSPERTAVTSSVPRMTRAVVPSLLIVLAFFAAALAVTSPATADRLPPDKPKAVKNATGMLQVDLPNGQTVTGSGLFAYPARPV